MGFGIKELLLKTQPRGLNELDPNNHGLMD